MVIRAVCAVVFPFSFPFLYGRGSWVRARFGRWRDWSKLDAQRPFKAFWWWMCSALCGVLYAGMCVYVYDLCGGLYAGMCVYVYDLCVCVCVYVCMRCGCVFLQLFVLVSLDRLCTQQGLIKLICAPFPASSLLPRIGIHTACFTFFCCTDMPPFF
jgi:hypothetical protein